MRLGLNLLGLLLLLLVGVDVKRNEQDQVGGQDQIAVGSSILSAVTATLVGQDGGKVFVSVEGVGGKVHKDHVNHKLQDLETGDPLLPPHLDAAGAQVEVPVHLHVHSKVQRDGHPLDGGPTGQLRVAQQRSSTVVVHVQKQQLLPHKDEEDGVEQFKELGQVVEVVKGDELGCESLLRADGKEQTVLNDHGQQLFDE